MNDSTEPAAQPAGGGDGQAQRWTGDGQGQTDQRPGDQQADCHSTRLHRAKLGSERGRDGVRVAELGDRCRGRLRLGASPRLVGLEGFQQPVAQLIGDRGPDGWWPGKLGRDRGQVVGDRVAVGRVAQVVAGHGRSPSRAVTAAENSCQEDRSSLSMRRPAAVSA